MKNRIHFLISITIALLSMKVFAQDHAHHAQHNMVLFGSAEAYYASHITYKVPHNFQVILKLDLSEVIKTKITSEMQSYPDDQFIYLLSQMDISQIESKPQISGQIFRISSDGQKHVILDEVDLQSHQYSLIYFNELPLSLEGKKTQAAELSERDRYKLPPKENCGQVKNADGFDCL